MDEFDLKSLVQNLFNLHSIGQDTKKYEDILLRKVWPRKAELDISSLILLYKSGLTDDADKREIFELINERIQRLNTADDEVFSYKDYVNFLRVFPTENPLPDLSIVSDFICKLGEKYLAKLEFHDIVKCIKILITIQSSSRASDFELQFLESCTNEVVQRTKILEAINIPAELFVTLFTSLASLNFVSNPSIFLMCFEAINRQPNLITKDLFKPINQALTQSTVNSAIMTSSSLFEKVSEYCNKLLFQLRKVDFDSNEILTEEERANISLIFDNYLDISLKKPGPGWLDQ